MSRKILPTVFFVLLTVSVARADGLRDNDPKSVRPVPRPGVRPAGSGFVQLPDKLKDLRARITRAASSRNPAIRALIPDVEIYYRAVNDAMAYNEFFSANDVKKAHELLAAGAVRANQLIAGQAPWTRQTGLVVRGFVSKLDRTVQPYGLVIPESYDFDASRRHRLDIKQLHRLRPRRLQGLRRGPRRRRRRDVR